MNELDQILSLPTGLLVLLGVLVVVELALLIIGVVAWTRTPDDRMPLPNKWLWLAVIVLVQIFGPIAFLILRRQRASYAAASATASPAPSGQVRRSAADAADLLYGQRGNDQ